MNEVTVNVKPTSKLDDYLRSEITGGYQRYYCLQWRSFVYVKWGEESKLKSLYQQLVWNIH